MLERVLPGAANLQNLHPLFVHFPIAFLYGAALLYLLGWFSARPSMQWTAFAMLVMGAIGCAASLATGLYAAPGVMVSQSVRSNLLQHHEHLMVTASVLTGALTAWAIAARPMPLRGRYAFMLAMLALVLTLAAGADLGGRMVYDYNAGGAACQQPIDFAK